MLTSYWGLAQSPFTGGGRGKFFFASPTHDEALARLGFLVQARQCLGILTGCEGSGRSTVLDVFATETRRRGSAVCRLNLMGLDERALLWALAASLGTNPRSTEDIFLLGRRIHDRLRQHTLQDRGTVLLLDDADQASHEALVQVLRLLKTGPQRLTIILALEVSRMSRLGGDLLQLSQLRIRLDPWNTSDIREFLAGGLRHAGCERQIFADSAAQRLFDLSDGVPRWVSQLAELALLAAAEQQRQTIDGELIEGVYRELSASFEEEPARAAY